MKRRSRIIFYFSASLIFCFSFSLASSPLFSSSLCQRAFRAVAGYRVNLEDFEKSKQTQNDASHWPSQKSEYDLLLLRLAAIEKIDSSLPERIKNLIQRKTRIRTPFYWNQSPHLRKQADLLLEAELSTLEKLKGIAWPSIYANRIIEREKFLVQIIEPESLVSKIPKPIRAWTMASYQSLSFYMTILGGVGGIGFGVYFQNLRHQLEDSNKRLDTINSQYEEGLRNLKNLSR
ncbi:MAG: hypothetical protein J0L93_10730 [Deltaproteobacteria bacterium]|nr:hypothetical protein [Deltaproteobacteria bacterium]